MSAIIKGILISRTPKALLVEQEGVQHWIPESVCDQISLKPKENNVQMVELKVEEWFSAKTQLKEEM